MFGKKSGLIGTIGTIGDIIVGNVFPTKAPPVSKTINPIVKDLVKVGAGAALASTLSPSLFKLEVNMNFYQDKNGKYRKGDSCDQEDVIIIDQAKNRPAPTAAPRGYLALPETPYREINDHPIDLVKEQQKAKEGKAEAENIQRLIVESVQQKKPAEAARMFITPPHAHHHDSGSISPIEGIRMDIVKTEDDDPPAIDLSPMAVQQDKQTLESIVNQFSQPNYQPQTPMYSPYSPQVPSIYPQTYYQAPPAQAPIYQQPQADNVSIDTSLVKFDKADPPKPNQWPDAIQSKLPNAEEIPFINKYDNRAMFIKFPELAYVQQIAEENKTHVNFIEVVFENREPNSRVIRVDSYNDRGQPLFFKSFFIDFGNIIDRRTKVFLDVNSPLEGQQAWSFNYIPNKKEKISGDDARKQIDKELFQMIFYGGVSMVIEDQKKKPGLYNPAKIKANCYCALITVPNKAIDSKNRSKIFYLLNEMAAPGGVFETAYKCVPGSRWRFEQVDNEKNKVTARNFVLTNLNVGTNYGSIAKAVKACKIISCEVDKKQKIIISIEGQQQYVYNVDNNGNITA